MHDPPTGDDRGKDHQESAEPTYETKPERLDRELRELLEGLRVVLPGVQVLFAFLLTAVFSARFEHTTSTQRTVYFVALCATALSASLLMVPSVWHRIRWRQHDKEHLLRAANRYAVAGMAFLAASMVGALYLVTDFVYESEAAAAIAGGLAAVIAVNWYAIPLLRQHRRDRRRAQGN